MKKYFWKMVYLVTFVFIIFASLGMLIMVLTKKIDLLPYLLAYIVLIAVVMAIMIVWMFTYVNKKNTDVELSKNIYFYAKPYILQINNDGVLLSSNNSFSLKIKDYEKYKTVYDFEVITDSIDVIHGIHKQESFITKIESNEGSAIFIKFLPLKSRLGYYLIGLDVTSDQNSIEYHRSMSLYNNVTNLPNRNYLGIKIQEIFDNKDLFKKKNSLVAIDILGFKNINRLFGNKIGDETLSKFGQILQESITGMNAMIFNTDSDDFMVLFNDLAKYQAVEDWASRLLEQLSKPIDIQKNYFNLETKIGIFHLESDKYSDLNPVIAFDNAFLALEKAKVSRRFNIITYDISIGKTYTREQMMEIDLISAVKNHELEMYLQPQVNLKTNLINGFEALIRWNNPKYENESTIRYIELAEKNNLIVDVGRMVISEAFKFAKKVEPYNIRTSINISPVQLLKQGFVNEVIDMYDKLNFKKNLISIEITETFLMESFDQIIDKLTYLKSRGFKIFLDNFGTGYSSMLYLKDLPINGISINKEFIKSINTDNNTRTIIANIISLGISLNLEVVAEGVEDEIQKKFLLDNGCQVIQGYIISKALPVLDAILFLKEYNKIKKLE